MRRIQPYHLFERSIDESIVTPKGWKIEDNSLYKKFIFKSFDEAFDFMKEVAKVAKKMDHHPKWTNIYKTVECWLRTHDAGDAITEKDRELALAMNKIALK